MKDGATMLVPKQWDDDELEWINDSSASAARDMDFVKINPSSINALVCEVQAWRRENPTKTFVSGPNEIREK
jgi:hypothetical protein